MRILIAEDERITRRSLQRQLEGWGHDVVAAEDGAVAWSQFQEQPFDIVVTDWDMPELDGRQLVEHIRRHDRAGYTYLIMLTGRSEKADLVAGMEAGADDFLAKPFDRSELRVRLNAGERIIRLERELAARNQALSEANARMKRDLDAAAAMQRDLLPKRLPEDIGARFAWYYEPCDELGGDILNVLPFDDGSVAMYLLDVTGHGVPAALLSVAVSRVLTTRDSGSSVLVTEDPDAGNLTTSAPCDVAERLNRQFPMSVQGNKFFTLAYAVLDPQSLSLCYALAGQPAPILIRKGETPRELAGEGFPIGVIDDAEFEDHVIQLKPGDRLYFYSDGVTEAMNEQNQLLGTERFVNLLEQKSPLPVEEGLSDCIRDLKNWCSPRKPDDDISLLALEIPENGQSGSP